MRKDDHLIYENFLARVGAAAVGNVLASSLMNGGEDAEDLKNEEDLPTRSHEIIAAIMPKDININGKKNETEFFNKAFPYVVKIIFDGDERRAQRYMYYDEDFNSDLISTYSYFQKHGFPKLRERDVERINRKMHGNVEEKPQQYAKDMEKDYTSQKISGEDAEMPEKDFNKLKQHINKGPIQIKKPTKELPYTHKYINQLAKQDPREGQREENAEKRVYDDVEVAFNLNGREYIAYGDVHFGEDGIHGKGEDTVENFVVLDAQTRQEIKDGAVLKHGYNAVYNAGVNQSAEENGEDEGELMTHMKQAGMIPQSAKPTSGPHTTRERRGENEERRIDPKCWKGYHKQGTKLKDGKRVNNCVKNS